MNILLPRAYFQTRGSQTPLIYTKTLCTHIFFLVPFFVLKHAPHVSPSLSRRDRSILSLSLSSLSLSLSLSLVVALVGVGVGAGTPFWAKKFSLKRRCNTLCRSGLKKNK